MRKMKNVQVLLSIVIVFAVTSCMMSGSSDENESDRNVVLGNWEITRESYVTNKNKNREVDARFVVAFQLNTDSTATVIYEINNQRNEVPATWIWKAEKKIGNENFGLSLNSDVVIHAGRFPILGLILNQKKDELSLSASDYLFEKV